MRHGEAAYVAEDGTVTNDPRNVPLTATGREQASIQGQLLADIAFDKALCSGLPRTVETATRVLAESKHPTPTLNINPALEEIHGLGKARKPPATKAEALALLEQIANPWADGAEPDATFLGGDRFDEFGERVTQAWQDIIQDPSWSTLLLVLHGAVNRMIYNHIQQMPWSATVCIEQDNCCINIIDVDSEQPPRYLIRTTNLTAYNLNKQGIVRTNMEDTAERMGEVYEKLFD